MNFIEMLKIMLQGTMLLAANIFMLGIFLLVVFWTIDTVMAVLTSEDQDE